MTKKLEVSIMELALKSSLPTSDPVGRSPYRYGQDVTTTSDNCDPKEDVPIVSPEAAERLKALKYEQEHPFVGQECYPQEAALLRKGDDK